MEHRNTAMFGGGCGDQGVGQRNTVVPVAVLSQLADRAHCCLES
jgi:hypothetical protein